MADAVLITGATAGIGQELARRLLQQGRRVIVHGRSRERAEAAVERIGGGEVAVADLASFAQVRALAADVAERFGELGGIGYNTAPPARARTTDGHEPTWQVNGSSCSRPACSPGWIATKMGGAGGGSLAEGVDTPLWLLTEPALAGTTGRYFWSRHEEEPNPQVEDAAARARLWDLAERSVSFADRPGEYRSGRRR